MLLYLPFSHPAEHFWEKFVFFSVKIIKCICAKEFWTVLNAGGGPRAALSPIFTSRRAFLGNMSFKPALRQFQLFFMTKRKYDGMNYMSLQSYIVS